MRRFSVDRKISRLFQLNAAALAGLGNCGLRSPADIFARLGVLMLIALCFGLVAQLLLGART